jgi:ketosteroid isomerase-like protein
MSAESPTERNKRIVMETWQAFWRNDIDAALVNMTEDVHWWNSGDGPLGTDLHGHDGIRTLWGKELNFFRDLEKTEIGLHAADDFVIREAGAIGHLIDGTPYQNQACTVHEFKDGKIVRVRQYVDTKTADAIRQMLERLGTS